MASNLSRQAMTRSELIETVAEHADMPKTKASQVVDAVFDAIQGALVRRQEVRLTGFGTFMASTRKATTGRNPQTGEKIEIGPSTSVRFKPGKTLKAAME